MSTLDRLKRLTGEDEKSRKKQRDEQIDDLRRRIEAILERRPGQAKTDDKPRQQPLELMAVTEGEEVVNECGKVFVAHGHHPLGDFYGRRRIREVADLDMNAAALLANDLRLTEFDVRQALFLDTETTGLAGGTGTLAFLIGVGWLGEDGFVTRQILARDFTEEPAALAHLRELAADKKFLVTFNGKTFDVGLLAARFVMNRQPDELSSMPHLDLLHSARRLVGHRLENARLVTLEEQVLGVVREGDVPGSEIPQRYFDFLRYRDARLLADVLEHNRLDVVSMATLSVHLTELLTLGVETPDARDPDVLAAARLHLERGDTERARMMLTGLSESVMRDVVVEARRILSLVHKRAECWPEAVAIWERILEEDPHDVFAVEEMAKYYEHKAGEFERALELVERVLLHERLPDEPTCVALRHRMARLQRRAEKMT